jgi:hypothetical protein
MWLMWLMWLDLHPIFAQNIHNPCQNSPKHMLSLEHHLFNFLYFTYLLKNDRILPDVRFRIYH